MAWSFSKLNLKWYEFLWAELPLGLTVIGGAIGALFGAIGVLFGAISALVGGIASYFNIRLMRSDRGAVGKYGLTGLISLASVGLFIAAAKLFIVTIGAGSIVTVQVEQVEKNSPVFAAIQKADPATYRKIHDVLIAAVRQKDTPAQINLAILPYIATITKRSLPAASDTAVLDFARVLTLEIDQVGAKSADACVEFLFPRPGVAAVIVSDFVTPEVLRSDVAATTEVISSGFESRRPVPTLAEISASRLQVSRQLVAQYGIGDVQTLGSKPSALSHATICAMDSQIFKNILSLPKADAAAYLRFVFAQVKAS